MTISTKSGRSIVVKEATIVAIGMALNGVAIYNDP
jgi:hypothetical protein